MIENSNGESLHFPLLTILSVLFLLGRSDLPHAK